MKICSARLRRPFPLSSLLGLLGFFSLVSSGAAAGPDLAALRITSIVNNSTGSSTMGYSVGVMTCNEGDTPVLVCDTDSVDCSANEHPIFVFNLYRLHEDLFEQIGMSWVQHITSVDNVSHGACGSCTPPPLGAHQLGVGCADFVSGAEAGVRPLAMRSEVDPAAVTFPFPFTSPAPTFPSNQFLQVRRSDLQTPHSRYFLEVQVLAADDVAAGNWRNNSVTQEVLVDPVTFDLTLTGTTFAGTPAVLAWRRIDSEVEVVTLEVPGSVPPQRFYVGYKVFRDFDWFYQYRFAVQNLNSVQGGQRLALLYFDSGVDFYDLRAKTLPHHSGEVYAIDGWDDDYLPPQDAFSFFTDTFAEDPNANALRWGTTFSFSFDSDGAFPSGFIDHRLHLFGPGTVTELPIVFSGPEVFSDGFESGDLGAWSGTIP